MWLKEVLLRLMLNLLILKVLVAFEHDVSDLILKDPMYHNFMNVFRSYQMDHNAETVFSDPNFCQRRFVIGTYACPQQIGNHMHEFLNGYAAAIVTNRTLLWNFCSRKPCQLDNEGDCDQVMERFAWIPSYRQFESTWREKNCSEPINEFLLVKQYERYRAEEIFMCCGIDQLYKHPVINVGTHEMHELAGVIHRNAYLLDSTKQRVKTLFEKGDDFFFGMLLRTSFRFRSFIVQSNDEVIKNSEITNILLSHSALPTGHHHVSKHGHQHPPPIAIGVHLRHSSNSADVEHVRDKDGIACVNKILASANHTRDSIHHRPCVIFLASDRNQSLNYWRSAEDVYCKVLTADHSKSHVEWNEHGPFTGEVAMKDLELVSRADYFVGSMYNTAHLKNYGSTFSLLMVERRASSGRRQSLKSPARFIPECVELLANRQLPKEMYINSNFTCSQGAIPDGCPHVLQQ